MKLTHIQDRPIVLSCAGFDPCAGAGLLADVRAFERTKCYGMAVETCATIQHESQFVHLESRVEYAQRQLSTLLEVYEFKWIKIGLFPHLDELKEFIVQFKNKAEWIFWDPILKASAGFDFNHQIDKVKSILSEVNFWIPNLQEWKLIFGDTSPHEISAQYSHLWIYLKGGHGEGSECTDQLFHQGGLQWEKSLPRIPQGEKHGSGCHLSALILGFLAQSQNLPLACELGRTQMQQFLTSSPKLLGNY